MKSNEEFLASHGFGGGVLKPIAGDASTKTFHRLQKGDKTYILMRLPTDDTTYSAEAGLAKNCLPFLAVGAWLDQQGLRVPQVAATDVGAGLILLEDLGVKPYNKKLLGVAVSVLNQIHKAPAPKTLSYEGDSYALPPFTQEIYQRESLLFLEWRLPALGVQVEKAAALDFKQIWLASWELVCAHTNKTGEKMLLRDYHSPNFLCQPHATKDVLTLALLDYQDALRGSSLYDLVSLTQDARINLTNADETHALNLYQHPFDDAVFAWLGAQRALKVMGIFHRFASSDGNPDYLQHLPRIEGYLKRNLAHPALTDLRRWLGAVL